MAVQYVASLVWWYSHGSHITPPYIPIVWVTVTSPSSVCICDCSGWFVILISILDFIVLVIHGTSMLIVLTEWVHAPPAVIWVFKPTDSCVSMWAGLHPLVLDPNYLPVINLNLLHLPSCLASVFTPLCSLIVVHIHLQLLIEVM